MAGEAFGITLRAGVIVGSIIRLMRWVKTGDRTMRIDLSYDANSPVWGLTLSESGNDVATTYGQSLESVLSQTMLKVGV